MTHFGFTADGDHAVVIARVAEWPLTLVILFNRNRWPDADVRQPVTLTFDAGPPWRLLTMVPNGPGGDRLVLALELLLLPELR